MSSQGAKICRALINWGTHMKQIHIAMYNTKGVYLIQYLTNQFIYLITCKHWFQNKISVWALSLDKHTLQEFTSGFTALSLFGFHIRKSAISLTISLSHGQLIP